MLFKFLSTTFYFIMQSTETLTVQQAEIIKIKSDMVQLSKLTSILSIALITILTFLIINLYKVHKLKTENKRLKNQISN